MIGVQSRKFSLTRKIFHNDPHHRGMLVFKEPERKGPLLFIPVPRFDVWLMVVLIQILCFIPFFPTFRILAASTMMEDENVNVTPIRVTLLSQRLATKSLVSSG